MPFVYRYIDLEAHQVVYVGKVTKDREGNNNPIQRRHEQHMREEWHKKNSNNLIMQYIEVHSHADADILETWLISQYGATGQLFNVSKNSWGISDIDLWPVVTGKWRTYQRGCGQAKEAIYHAAEVLYQMTEGLEYNVNSSTGVFMDMIRDIVSEKAKVERLSRYDEQDDFMRWTDFDKARRQVALQSIHKKAEDI